MRNLLNEYYNDILLSKTLPVPNYPWLSNLVDNNLIEFD